ncbi:MAG: ABC transporter substrate-binding protein [Aggregatilineales bacterium]
MIGRAARRLLALLGACALTACAALPTPTPSPEAVAPTRAGQTATATLTPTATSTPPPPAIRLWLPALFAYESELFTAAHLSDLLEDYTRQSGQSVAVRLRRADGLGGIFETLSSAAPVASSVIPDAVLLRARDLPRAAAARLIVPLSPTLLSEQAYFGAALALARYQGEFYGIPHLLELQHAVYRGQTPPATWQSLISRQIPYLFAAGVARGVNSTLLSHYLTLGGKLSDQNGEPSLDGEPLLSLLRLYSAARAAGSLPVEVLDYADPTQYWSAFVAGRNAIVQVDSTFYLRQSAQSGSAERAAWQLSALPQIESDKPLLSPVDGWLWAFTTADGARQQRALALIEWLQEPERFAAFTQRVGMLPARRDALRAWSERDYAAFVAPLLDANPVLPPDSVNGILAEALQESFARLLRGELDAESAAESALERARAARER